MLVFLADRYVASISNCEKHYLSWICCVSLVQEGFTFNWKITSEPHVISTMCDYINGKLVHGAHMLGKFHFCVEAFNTWLLFWLQHQIDYMIYKFGFCICLWQIVTLEMERECKDKWNLLYLACFNSNCAILNDNFRVSQLLINFVCEVENCAQ